MQLEQYKQISFPQCQFTRTGLQIDETITLDNWKTLGSFLRSVEGAVQFWIGDWIRFGEHRWGEKYKKAIEETEYDQHSLENMKYVAANVDNSLRRENLSFGVHKEVAPFEPKEQEKWLDKAETENLSVKELRSAIKSEKIQIKKIQAPESQVTLTLGDFRNKTHLIDDNSIDLILTDPPYPKEYRELWNDLGLLAKAKLKEGGFLIAYSGQNGLPDILQMLSRHLNYYWLGMLYHKGPVAQRFEVNMFNRAKPILFFYKEPRKKQPNWIDDVLISEMPDKNQHEWGQNIEPLIKLVETFTEPNDYILDPFMGGGSVIEAAIKTKRNVHGIEIDEKYYNLVQERLR